MNTKNQEKKDVSEWFWKFRPDMKINEIFIEDLYNQYLSSKENLSLDEKGSFYSYIVFNYKSERINLIYSILEGNKNYNAILERWIEEDCDIFHIGNLMELIDKNDPFENQEKYPQLDFNDEDINAEYFKFVKTYIDKLNK